MRIEQTAALDFLGRPGVRFAIPVFQRVYSWSAWQCEELFGDCLRAGESGEPHFMGLLLYSLDSQDASVLDVIDGQQRLTTLSLLIAALDRRDLAARYLQTFTRASSTPRCKLELSGGDRETLPAIIGLGEMPEEPASRLVENYLLFKQKLDDDAECADTVLRGLKLLQIAAVELEPADSPQLVFESLNSKGMPLTTADRARNLLIASSSADEQAALLEGKWLPLAQRAEAAEPPATMTNLLHAWLAERYRSIRIFDRSEVYGLLKQRLRDEFDDSWERLLDAVTLYANTYLSDPEVREEADESAARWIEGKPDELISEYKMFGD